MSNKIPWKAFSARRKITLVDFIRSRMPMTYELLVSTLHNVWVEPPTEQEYEKALAQVIEGDSRQTQQSKPTKKAANQKTSTSTQKSAKKKSTAAPEDPQEVWEDAQEGAYQAKKTPARKTSTRKTSTRKTSTRKTSTTKKKS